MGTFKCFLRWKSTIYRINTDVLSKGHTTDGFSKETSFLMGILKPCFMTNKKKSNSDVSTQGEQKEDPNAIVEDSQKNSPMMG